MAGILTLGESRIKFHILLLDIFALSFLYFIPALSHLFAFPVYYLEPMRIALIASIIFTGKKNTFLIALTIPAFSFLVASHPSAAKAILLSIELIWNVYLFYFLNSKMKNIFWSAFLSIILSKATYYLLKFFFITGGLLTINFISTPIYYQIGTTIVLSFLVYFILNKKSDVTEKSEVEN